MEQIDTSAKFVNKVFRYMKNDMPIETFMEKFNVSNSELNGIVELCKLYGKDISIEMCKSFVPSPHCEEVVRVYISTGSKGEQEYLEINELGNLLDEKKFSNILKTKFRPMSKYYELLNKIIMRFS